jgi:hypothetical protein
MFLIDSFAIIAFFLSDVDIFLLGFHFIEMLSLIFLIDAFF